MTADAAGATDARSPHGSPTYGGRRKKLVDTLLINFELAIYWSAFILLGIAAIIVISGGVIAVVELPFAHDELLDSGMTILDRVLLVVIVAELAYTLRTVIQNREVVAEPFLLIGIIAIIRRVLIITAEFEEAPSREEMEPLLFELGGLSVMVFAITISVFILRHSSRHSLLPHLRRIARNES